MQVRQWDWEWEWEVSVDVGDKGREGCVKGIEMTCFAS